MTDWEQPHWSGKPQERRPRRPRLKPNAFSRLARACARQSIAVLVIFMVTAILASGFATLRLSLDPDALPDVTLDPQTVAAQQELERHFPGIESTISAIVTGEDGEAARSQSLALAAQLNQRPDLFSAAFVPGTGDFYAKYGVLFRDKAEIDERISYAQQMQPLFHALGAAPDLQGLATLITEIGKAVEQGRSPPGLATMLRAVSGVIESEVAGTVQHLDWPRLAGLTIDTGSRVWFVIAMPEPGQERLASSYARQVSASMPNATWLWPRRALGEAGNPLRDFAVPAGLAALVVLTLLVTGLGAIRYAAPVIMTGVITTALASSAAALINPALDGVTWSFAAAVLAPALVLSTLLVLAHVQARLRGAPVAQAIMLASHRRGGLQTMIAMIFMAFWLSWLLRQIPSLSEFAVIAVVGTLIALLASLTLVPAALAAFDRDDLPVEVHWLDQAFATPPTVHGRNLLQISGMLIIAAGVFCVVFLPSVKFGERLLNVDPPPMLDTPDGRGAIHILTAPGDPARAIIASLSTVPEVGAIRWAEQFLPLETAAKAESLRRLEGFLPGLPAPRDISDAAAITAIFEDIEAGLRQIASGPAADAELRDAAHRLRRSVSLLANPQLPGEDRVLTLEDALFSGLGQLSRIAENLARIGPPALSDLDPALRRRFESEAGMWRIEVMPKPGVGALSFAAAVRKIVPDAAGEPVLALSRNEIMHHEAVLAFAAALTAAVLLAFVALREPVKWLLTLPATMFFVTFSAASVAIMGVALNSAMLAAVSCAAALAVASAVILADEVRPGRRREFDDVSMRAGILPLLVLLGTVAPLIISGNQPVAAYGAVVSIFLLIVLGLNLLLLPALSLWLDRLFHR